MHFTAEDLLRVTFARSPAPLMELGLTLAGLQRTDLPPVFGRWRQSMRRLLPRGAGPLLELVPPSAHGPLFLDPPTPGLDEGIDQVRATRPGDVRYQLDRFHTATGRPVTSWHRQLAAQDGEAWGTLVTALHTTHDALLTSFWPRLRAAYDAEYAWRTRLLAQYGIRDTLAGIAPGARWRGTTLEIPRPQKTDIVLGGRGLTLMPSPIWSSYPLLAPRHDGPGLLVYPAVTPLPLCDAPDGSDPLAALLGTTRAAVLHLLTTERTTTDVSAQLAIANSSASEHTKALRAARLITSRREGKTMRHQCTPLGLDLLTGNSRP
ncbi:ArsR/SmtB family transcription factor [Streptomyces sp. NPDC055078]